MPPGSNADVQWKPVKMLYRYPARNGYYGYEIRIGCWVINGKEGDLILAKQEFKVGDSGYVTWGKARGLTAADLYRIFEQAKPIAELMNFPLPKEFLSGFKDEDLFAKAGADPYGDEH